MFAYRLPLFLAASLGAARLFGAYTYAIADPLTSITSPDPNRWFVQGSPTAGTGGLSGDGSLIFKQTPPGGFSNYEVRAKLNLPSGGGSYVLYLRASDDARLSNGSGASGTFLAFEVVVEPNLVNGACVASVKGWRRAGNALSPMTTNPIPCYSGMEVRAVAMPGSQVVFFVDGVYYGYWADYVVTSGRPGIGGFGMGAGNSISRVDIGAIDTIAPSAVPLSSVATAVFANRVEFQWPGVPDDANGIGIWGYNLFRNGSYIGVRQSPEMVDESAQPGTSYLYQVQTVDFHGNSSGVTDIPVTTPAMGNVDPRRTGVRPLGTYWGGLGEQIDLQSGNVNFSMPLFKAQARGGWGVTFALSYNSQNWRRDTAGTPRTWNHGRDIGYGYGWKFLAGSMTPVFSGYYNVGHYRFTDSTGAEYRFYETSFGSGEWLAKDGLFLTYKSAEKRLYFPDGSWWHFGSMASGTEMDTGTMYPTLFQDRNGNQIKVRYRPGRGLAAINGSGRIWQVEDVRVSAGAAAFSCNYLSDSLQHLHTCATASGLNTGENYEVGIGAAAALTDPFLGQSFGDKQLLGGITNTTPGVNAPYYFGYDNGATNGPGELTAAVFPYGGSLHWTYSVGTLAGGRQFRRAHYRSYNANDGQGGKTSTIDMYPGPDASLPVHQWSVVSDPTGHHDKAWWWNTSFDQATMGLSIAMAERDRQANPWRTIVYRTFAWSLTGNGNPYIGTLGEVIDPGLPHAKDRRTTQLINNDGNLKERMEYPDGTSTLELRKYAYTYVAEGAPETNPYRMRHLRNLVSTVTVSRPLNGTQTAQSIVLAQNSYDQYGVFICAAQTGSILMAMPNATQHDSANFPASMPFRGNLTRVATPQGQRCMSYNIGGVALSTWDGYGHSSSVSADPQRNYAVPSAITTGSYTNTLTWDGTLNMIQNTGPNGAQALFGWDSLRREVSRTLPNGAVINHQYGIGQGVGASWHKVTTGLSPNFRWTKTVFDGFGRTREVISGYKVGSTETAVSKVVTNYAPCACSPIGKVEWVTMPIGPTADPATAAKTVYAYDALGRTVTVTPPGNSGVTSYVYEGRTVKTVDPKNDWKRIEQDAIGNLVKVYEPRPGGGADYVTEYTYSVLGQLTKVRMERPSVLGSNPPVVQERLFAYNNKEQLVSETQPEHGTTAPGVTGYAYNFDGSLQEKTDPKGQKVQWFYDALGRPTEVKKLVVGGTEDACGKVRYQYDSQDKDGTFAGTNLAGRVASVETGCSTRGGLVQELYSYNVAGAVTTKRVRIVRGSSTVTKNIGYTFDAEGKLATVQYPDVSIPFTYFYDNMGRPNRMTGIGWDVYQQTITSDHVTGVSYGLGGELLGMTYLQSSPMEQQENRWFTETRSYNSRLQLTRQTTALLGGGTLTDIKYKFSASNNDGRLESRENAVSGEVVNFQYDSLKRLTSATQTAGPVVPQTTLHWGLSFTYDGFGNRWNQSIQGGKAGVPSALTFDETRNRITGQFWQYDANGNTTGMPQTSGLSYDVDDRLLTITREGSSEAYGYLADNKRFWKSAGGVESYYLYGVGGQRILTYSATFSGGVLTLGGFPKMDVLFAGRVIRTNGVAVVMDRLGSVVTRSTGVGTVANHRYYPYGEEIGATVGDRTKFATYHRDQTGVDYADQRYYGSHLGRYLTQDPCRKADDLTNPITLNRFLYVLNDPVNRYDPSGLISSPSLEQAPECNSGSGGGGGGGDGSNEYRPSAARIKVGSWDMIGGITRNIAILASSFAAAAATNAQLGQTNVTHLMVEVDCVVYNDFEAARHHTRKRKYVAYNGSQSLEGDARVIIQEFVLNGDGKFSRNISDPNSTGKNGIFSDTLGQGLNPFNGVLYQYFEVTIAGTPFVAIPVPIFGYGTYLQLEFSYVSATRGKGDNVTINGDAGFSGLRECTKDDIAKWNGQ